MFDAWAKVNKSELINISAKNQLKLIRIEIRCPRKKIQVAELNNRSVRREIFQ